MRKNKLIDILNQIDGNPDILLYNGFVDDFMDFNIRTEPCVLVKHTREFFYNNLCHTFQTRNSRLPSEAENQVLLNKAENLSKKEEWEFPNEFVTQDEVGRWYGNRMKKVFMIEARLRNKKCYDRAGSLEY